MPDHIILKLSRYLYYSIKQFGLVFIESPCIIIYYYDYNLFEIVWSTISNLYY